ncbi:AAA domain, dynein subfamily protein (macronuclear) [Tetrahymena thermophila SB210]|uniref:AAA domain, dynein subfamily protein n=1 Tax=Tetrahymena thermophila (strain SB210) TaxID=312017 RepID=Q22SD1_TETTS|nr:AAA domain, dynein subfamily protein [Tetrahymena thermophila SB210]EAR87841.2 AAA domain, dynein subfamily protein [Tetrahymena thermophila SB210]|eukprot:XP_001008086.2 AAA domain, dynein subfamily protein [Tetrahymena thermophila SB210]
MDRIEEKESNRIVFWLFIDGLNKYEKDLVIQFRQKDNKNYPLSPTHLHHDIFMISLKQNDIIHDYNKLQYRYIIKDYKAKEITREIPLKKKYEQVIHIFDTPDEFTNKYFIGLLGQDLLIQNNKEQSLLKFIQPNTSIMILNHLRDFIDEYKFPQLFYKFYEYSIKIIIQKLYNFRNYEEDIELYFNFLDLMNRQDQIKYIKTQNIVEIARSLSQYFMIFMKSYQLDQNNSKRLRHKLIDLYSQNTNFEQRINILLSDHCVWTDEEASNHINKKEYNQILLQYPNQYIEFFSKQTANYKDLFIEQIKRIIMLLAENKNENIISVLKTQKDIFRKLPKSVINKLQNQLFEIKNDIYYKQKVQEIFDNMKDIVEFFNIPKYQLKRQVISTLSCLKHSSTEEKTLDFFIQTCMQYKIDVFSFEFLEHRFTMQYYYNQQLMESFIEQIIEINPFTNLKPILKKFYDKYTEYVQSQKIVDIIKLKTKYVGYLQKLYAKQKLILQKRESKSKQNQSDHIIKSNIDQLQKSSVSSQQKDLNISDNQWSNDILTDDRIKQMKEEQKQASELEGNQSILVEEKNLKEDLHKRQREISLTEESVKQFEQQLYIIVERIMTNTATKNLIEVTNLNELNEQERQLFDSIKDNISYLRMKRENQNESDFFKNYSEAKYYKGSDKDLTTVFNIFDQLAIERVNQLLENRQIYHIFGSSFINRFLPICDKSLKFYKVVEENVKKVNQSISQGLYNTEQIKEVCAQNFYEQIMDQFDIQANKQQLQEQIKQIENKDKNYRIFFYKFEEYLTEYYEIIQKTKISQLQLSQIPQFFQQFQQFDILSNKFLEVNNSKIVQSICTQLNTYQCNQTLKEIEQIKQQQDQVLQLGNLKTQIYQIRMANFSEMLFKLIENLYIFSNVIYGCDKGSIKNLDELNKIATLLLSNFIRQEENQQNQNSLLMMQQNIQNQENQQIIKQDQQQLQGYTLFNTEVSLNNLKPYFGDGLDEIIQNIKEFHSILGVQADLYQTEQNFKKCFTSTFYLDCFSIIQEVAETLKLDWKLQENVQMKSLQSLLLNYKDLKNQPIKVVMQIEISQQIIQDYQVIAREKDIQRNMELLIKSQHIIEHSKQNKVNNISYLDMRDFIGDNDYDLSSFLTVLNEFAQFFLELSETQSEIINNKKSILKAMIQLNNVIQNQIKTDSRVSQWEEIIKNFHKIASIQNNIDKKKSYLNLLKKMYTDGKTTIEIDNLRSQVTYLIECDQKCYSEQEINEISSRVLIEKNSIKAIFGQEKQQISQSQQKLTMANPNLNQEKLQILQQEQKMEKFKKQLELTQDLKQIIQEMISYGYFLFEKKQYIYNNKNNYYLQNMIDMNQQLQKFQNLLKDWKNEIERVTRKYPKFTFISYSYYPIIDQYLSKSIFEADLSQSLKQIIQYQVQTSPFNNRNINNIFQNYKNCEQQLKLDQIASFITSNQFENDQGGMMRISEKRIKLIQYSTSKEALYYLLAYNQNPINMKSEYFLFCDKKTCIQDVQLFIQRYKYLNQNQPMNFFLIINSSSINSYFSELTNLQNEYQYSNNFYILIKKDFYDDRLNLIQQDFGYQNKAQNIENLKKQQHIKQIYKNACFFTSSEPGAGKTFAVKLKSQQYKKQLIRIPTNGDGDKDSLIKYLMKNIQDNSDQQRIYHIDLYENDHLDLDFTLFEMIILKSINFNSKSFLDLGSQSVFLVEINNTLRNSLVDQIHIKDYFEVNQVTFNINSFNILSFEEKHNQAAALTVFKYLKSIKIQQTSNNNTYFDQQQNIDELQKIKSIDTILFSKLLDEYLVQYLNTNQINPNFWQINNFINLFGSEMQKMENSAYLQIPIVERAQLRLGLRTIIINKSFELCRKVSLSCLKNTYNQSNSVSNEQLLTNKAGSLIPFSSFLQDFVTFQEQDEACITSFFQNAETTPQPIKDMYAQYKLQLLHFDQEQRPEVLVNWLILLCNQHIQNFYKNQKEITFDKISNTELSKEVEKIIIQKDNFFKIAMIFMRIRSLTPIIIMGEAGIGKTALIRLLSLIMEANFNTKIIHGGVTEEEVIEFIEQSEAQLRNNSKKKTVLFFDEVNTNKLVCGLFKEIIVDRYLKGRKLHPNIIPIAALNPYKLKSEEQQKIIQIQIHGGIKQDLVNKIKGSDLEYTVNPIPDSMYSFSWNYGGLNQNDEKTYIQQILLQMNKELQLNSKVSYKIEMIKNTISELVFLSQEYMRKLMGTISACSLRDVKRFVTLLKNNINFLKTCSNLSQKNSLKIQDQNIQILAVYLSFYINYCVRIPLQEKREEYLKLLTNHYREFTNNQMQSEFDFVEKFLINQIDVPLGIAKNYSLRQNAFILFICIVNKIPVCLIGPPGSSKTLSLRLLIQSMQGVNSRSELFKKYPALMPQYYQGHIQSTSERIMEVFEQASKKQQGFNSKEVGNQNLSLVYIDEIGLAEISPHNPLKVLHATLEKPDIAVSCISNWPLDASKMNRMLTVYRMDINTQQLVETFQSIFEEIKDQQKDKLMINMLNESQLNCQEIQQKIANIYLNYLKNLKDHDKKYESFHGPRDFFSACKQICAEEINFFQSEQRCDQSSNSIKSLNDRIIKAFYRHFSGLEASQQLLQKQFIELNMNHSYEFRPSELIEQNLMEEPKFFTSRHLMVISDDIQNAMTFLKSKLSSREHQFFIGSDFADDKKMQACYNVINKIVSCIEKGMVVTLLNLDNIYQSLYEVLNQSYRYYNGKYFCKISFGAESSNIEVSQNFKLILLVNQNQIHRMDGPLLNRFEKHLLKDNMILSGDDADNIQILQKNFKQVEDYFCQHEKIAQTRYPLFKFTNKDSVVQNYYLQYKLQKEKAVGSNKDCKITDEEQEKIFMRIFNLTNFLSVFLKRDQPYINTMLDSYEKSEYHYSLSGFIQNRIYNQNINEHLISEWAYFQQKNKIKECQVRQFAVISQQTFITDSITSKLDVITLSQIVSEQDLVKKLTNFLNRGLPQIPQVQTKRFQTTFAQKKNMTDCLDDKYNSKQLQSDIKFMHNPIRVDQDILIVTGDMSKSGGDSYDRIVFTMHKIDECVDQFLANTKDQSVDSQNYSLQLNIIFVLKVEESYKMIPVEGRWENHSIEDLTPFHQFYNQQQDIGQLELNREIKQKLSMQNIMNDKNIQIQNVIGLDVITRFFIENDQQIFANAYRVIQYFPSSEINESEYKVEKLNQITKIFMEKYKDALIPIISQISYKIMKYQYSIDTFNGLVINYMIPKGFSVQSSSFHSCILAALEKIIETSITIIIYDLESNKLTYGMFKCEVPQFIQHSKSQINQIPDKYKSSSQDYLNPLKMCKNVVISESQEIFRVLNSYQMTIKHLKENIIEGQNELFQKMYKSVRENLRSYENILYLFSEQILMDILDENPGQINKIDIQIAQIILLIRKRIDRIDISEIQEQEQVNIKPFQSSQDTIIAIFLTLFILEDEIKDIRDFVEYYQLSIDNLRDEFVEMNRNNNLQFVQSIDLLKQMIIQRMFETVKPTSRYVQENKLLNQNYPAFTKLFLEYVDKNNTSYQYQHMKNQIVLVNIICEEFSEILVKKNLLINMKFDNIISLDYKELTEMRELFQVFYQDLYQEMRQSNIQNQQVYDNKQFIYKWNDFLKTLIISSTENNYYRIFSPHIIKILLQLEFDERDMHSCLSLQFRVFLNRVFKQISQCLSFESVQKSFCLDLQELFSDKNGQPYHIEYYTFQQFSETIQNCVYSYLLNEKANENIEFLFTLIEHEFSSLQTLQKVIYLSIFREFVYQMINVDDISKSLLAQKIYECSKNSMEVEDQYQNCYTTLDEQLQKYFLKLNYQPFQNFIIKNLLFFKKSIINFMNESFYLKNCNWLLNYIQDQFNYNQIYEISYQNQQLIAIQNKQQSLENMIFQQIPNCQNVFKELYNGIIQQDKYYPFNLQNYVQSKIDFYNVQQGDNLKSLYQCFLCRNFIVVDNNNQQFNNINVQCLSCLSNLSLNNQNEAILILNGLENKIGLRQSVQQQIGFCLRLDQITLCYNVNQQLPEIQALFNMLYHICLKLSLNLNPYNQLKQVTKIQYYTYDKQNNTVVTQEKSILLINKILNIPIEFDFMQYIDNQIYLSIETFQFIINQKRQYNQCKVMYLIKYLTEYLMHSNIQVTQLANQTQQNMAIQNQILIKMQEFDQLYSYQFAILSEDLSHCNLTQQTYIQSHPISLRLIYKNKDDNIIQNMKLNHQQNLQQYFPILLEYLDFDYLNFIHNSLKNFVIFYQQIIIYFSNQFEVTEAYKLTLKDALNKLKLDVSDQFYNWYLEQFVPCWNSVLQQIQNQCQDQQNLNQFLKKIDAKTQLLDLIYSSKYNTMFSAMLEYLCSIQNQLIQKLITYCQQNQQTPHVNKLYKDIWIQFLNRQGSQKTYGLQDIKPDLDIIKVPEKDLVEKFICQGQEYGDYIYNRKLYEFDSLQTSVIKSIFKKARLINLEKSIQFQFLLSFNELSPQNNEMTIPQEKIQQDIVQNLKQLLIDQDLVKEAYNKMLTIQSFFKSSPIQQSETSLSTAMKQINMNFNFQKLQNILEKCLLLKHLKDFIKLLEELNMNKFVQFCNLSYRVIQQNEIFNQLLQYIFSNQNLLTDFKLSIGRIIIRFLSSEKVQIDPQLSLLNIFQDQQFKIGCESQYFASQEFKNQIQPFKVCNCYQIYELITFYQGFEFKKTNLVQADGLFLENFTDDVFKKSIRELTLQQNQNK